jgi:hypothetical protein
VPFAQILFAALLAAPVRANVPLAALMTFVTNPFTTPLIWVAAYWVGSVLLRIDAATIVAPVNTAIERTDLQRFLEWLTGAGIVTAFGLVVIAVVSAAISYLLSVWIWRWMIAQQVGAPPGAAAGRRRDMSLGLQAGSRGLVDTLAVAAAVLASIAMIRLVTGSLPVTLAYAGGLVVLGLVAFAAARRRAGARRSAKRGARLVGHRRGDRAAGRGARHHRPRQPPGLRQCRLRAVVRLRPRAAALPVDGASAEALAAAARAAWREGESAHVTIADEQHRGPRPRIAPGVARIT